jgi:hypothetical protein
MAIANNCAKNALATRLIKTAVIYAHTIHRRPGSTGTVVGEVCQNGTPTPGSPFRGGAVSGEIVVTQVHGNANVPTGTTIICVAAELHASGCHL